MNEVGMHHEPLDILDKEGAQTGIANAPPVSSRSAGPSYDEESTGQMSQNVR
jgi:hypothetical protein